MRDWAPLAEVPERQRELAPDPASELDLWTFEDVLLDRRTRHQTSLETEAARMAEHQVLLERGEQGARLRERAWHVVSLDRLGGRARKPAAGHAIVRDNLSSRGGPGQLNLERGNILLRFRFCARA